MNSRQLEKLGVPVECRKAAIISIQNAASSGILRTLDVGKVLGDIMANPEAHLADPCFGPFAQSVLEAGDTTPPREPISYRTWGEGGIEAESHTQMRQACACRWPPPRP